MQPGQAFYDPGQFPFTAELEAEWPAIAQEYRGIRQALVDWGERKLYDEGWKVLAVYDFPHGQAIADNVTRCPRTAELVARLFPQHGAAGFSVLEPGTVIRPHQGYRGPFLRCHLGLEVPPGDCALEVEGQQHGWEEGRVLVFDDRLTHAAWNRTERPRVILLVDFVPEALPVV